MSQEEVDAENARLLESSPAADKTEVVEEEKAPEPEPEQSIPSAIVKEGTSKSTLQVHKTFKLDHWVLD